MHGSDHCVKIQLSRDEVATAIRAYLVAHGVHIEGPRSTCTDGNGVLIYVDPSGYVISDGTLYRGGVKG